LSLYQSVQLGKLAPAPRRMYELSHTHGMAWNIQHAECMRRDRYADLAPRNTDVSDELGNLT
jgi:hypothetical protein